VIDDPGYYEHLRQEIRLTFNYLLAAVTIYTIVIGYSGFQITEEQFFATVTIAVGCTVFVFLFGLATLGLCRRSINKKIRLAYHGRLVPEQTDVGALYDENQIDRVSIGVVRFSVAILYVQIFALIVRYVTFSPTPSGQPPLILSLIAMAALSVSLAAIVLRAGITTTHIRSIRAGGKQPRTARCPGPGRRSPRYDAGASRGAVDAPRRGRPPGRTRGQHAIDITCWRQASRRSISDPDHSHEGSIFFFAGGGDP